VTESTCFIGLISGTSRDGVDAALVEFETGHPAILSALCLPYPDGLAERLQRLLASGRRPRDEDMRALDPKLGRHFARAAQRLLDQAAKRGIVVRAIGSHGQTVWHAPGGPRPESIQLGQPGDIARHTGILTVGDFRRGDIAAGGQGAPLAPLLHRALFRPSHGTRIVLNLGGIANVSVLDARGAVAGFDTGPANCLLDSWIREQQGKPYDLDGQWAASGRANPALLQQLLRDPWFAAAPPKSTGIEYFNLGWLRQYLVDRPIANRDVQATLAELTAVSVAQAVRSYSPGDLLVCGGGVHNSDLLQRLRRYLGGVPVHPTGEFGMDPDWVEAVLFAWLARERLAGRKQDTRAITGARAPVLLGTVADPTALE